MDQRLSNKKDTMNTILTILSEYDLEQKIEILGNVFVDLGIKDNEDITNKNININNIYEIVLNDVKKNSDTLKNSLARQGLLILSWLNKEIT